MKRHLKKARQKYNYYRKMKTHQEMVANEEIRDEHGREKFGRARRGKRFLDPWTLEKPHRFENSWKRLSRERKQYRCYRRGTKHIYILPFIDFSYYLKKYNFDQYCNQHCIPHKVLKQYVNRKGKGGNKYSILVGIKFIWWANEDIGIEYILGKT